MACSACRGVLGFSYDGDVDGPDPGWTGMWRWWPRLPVDGPSGLVTLGEGGTPLLRSRSDLPVELWLKDETRNPTGSHKDRALAVAITAARARGVRRSAVVSAGSTGLAHAAYCARAGIESVVVMGSDSDPGRAALIAALGARPVRVSAPIDDAIERLQELGERGIVHVASTTRRSNPEQAEGCKTIAYEIVEQLGRAPDVVLVPTGGGGTIGAVHRGFVDERAARRVDRLPRLAAVVPERWNGLQQALATGRAGSVSVAAEHPPATLLGKLCHACPPDGADALRALRESGGAVVAVSDEEAIVAQREFAATEGLYLEVSSAVVLPAIRRLLAEGTLAAGQTVVALACGSGFRELPFAPPPAAPGELVALEDLETVVADSPC
jgi:threonine synthase